MLGLKEMDSVFAVISGKANDISVLKKPDVNLVLGKTGTNEAINAADIIILDDNFNSVIHAIKFGRNIIDNVKRSLQFNLITIFSFIILVFICSCIGSESPLSVVQILWIFIIIDTLGSLTLSNEVPNDELLHKKPYLKNEFDVDNKLSIKIIFQGLAQFCIIFFVYLFGNKFIKEDNPERINIIKQFKNCFEDLPIEQMDNNKSDVYYIINGKKSSWDPFIFLKRNLEPQICFFYDTTLFKEGQIKNLYEAYNWYCATKGNTVHMTIIFNIFVFYTLFNQINSRIVYNNFNIFCGILNNKLFILILSIEIIIQILLVQFGGCTFKCNKEGLTLIQWEWCLGFASTSFFVEILFKILYYYCNENFCSCCKKNDRNRYQLLDEERIELDEL